MTSPKIAFFDIENSPSLTWTWENYDTNVIRTERDWHLISFAVKWAHEDKVKVYALPDFPGYKKNKNCDKALCRQLWDIFNEADILVAHNSDFDIKKSNARFLVHGFKPPSPYKSICTLKMARRCYKFNSNKLDDLARSLKVGAKLPTTGKDLWFGCLAGNPQSWAHMRKYNAMDVEILEKVYQRMKPYAPNHPNLNLFDGNDGCPTCKSTNVQRRGFMVKLTTRRQRFHCQGCGHWFAGAIE